MAKKTRQTALTQRERESRKASKEKARQKRMHAMWQRVRLVMAIVAFVVFTGGGGVMWINGSLARMTQASINKFYAVTAQAGFTVQATYLEGRGRTDSAAIERALLFKKGDPILQVSLDEVKTRLEAIPTIKQAAVERTLPHALHIRIQEREPVAIWQNEGSLWLIDDEGAVMPELALQDYGHLPLLVGKGAPAHVKEALALLACEPELTALVQAVVRVGDRRWNVKLKQGMEIKLPQEHALQAWSQVSALQRDRQLLMRDIHAIDLREEGKLTLKLSQPLVPPAPASFANET